VGYVSESGVGKEKDDATDEVDRASVKLLIILVILVVSKRFRELSEWTVRQIKSLVSMALSFVSPRFRYQQRTLWRK
jgi:hypothetical protein